MQQLVHLEGGPSAGRDIEVNEHWDELTVGAPDVGPTYRRTDRLHEGHPVFEFVETPEAQT